MQKISSDMLRKMCFFPRKTHEKVEMRNSGDNKAVWETF